MTESEFQKTKSIFLSAIELPESEQADYLWNSLQGNRVEIRKIEEMLQHHEAGSGDFELAISKLAGAIEEVLNRAI